jgi:hypothetical protein
MDSNARRAREVQRKVWRDNDFLLPGKLLQKPPIVVGQSPESARRKARGSGAGALLALEQLRSGSPLRCSPHYVLSRFAQASSA